MYLLMIAKLIEDGEKSPIPLSTLAAKLGVKPVSASQMIRKIEALGYVLYQPYKGVALTPTGEQIAYSVLRSRRIWEVFLVDNLNFSTTEAREFACQLEHNTTDEFVSRLSHFLGDPETSPNGKPIPKVRGTEISFEWIPLNKLKIGQQAEVMQIKAATPTRSFLIAEGIFPGAVIAIECIGSEGALLIEVQGHLVHLTSDTANTIRVRIKSKEDRINLNRKELRSPQQAEVIS